jgi:hypothetical protein
MNLFACIIHGIEMSYSVSSSDVSEWGQRFVVLQRQATATFISEM